jgi:hypothetical protein
MTKMMYIPPFQMMGEPSMGTAFRHLMLPHLIYNPMYSNFFSKAKNLGQYIILDNGKAEHVQISHEKLAGIAWSYKVDELVLPDSMGDPEETQSLARLFLGEHRGSLPVKMKIGYALQGRTEFELKEAYDTLRKSTRLYDSIDVLYIPRLVVTPDNPRARVNTAAYIFDKERLPKPIHFLGASVHAIDEGKWVRDGLGGRIRSMDTSAPFVYALRGAYINDGSRIQRDIDTYFTSQWPEGLRHIAKVNMEIMNAWVSTQASASQV